MEYFQDDLFPDTRVWWEPALASDQWFAGKNGAQKRLSLRPADMKPCKLYVISKPCLDKMNIIKLRVNGLTGFPLMHTCDFTHKHATCFSWAQESQGCTRIGTTHASLQPFWKSPCVLSTCHIVYSGNMSTLKTLCNVFQPSRTKPTHTLSIGQEKKTDVDPCEISGPKESVFKFKWLYEFSCLMYISTNNHMKCKTCLDAYGCSAKPSQSYVQGATNFQRSALDHHQ